MTQPNNCCCL